jgi:hypothetical protein
MEVKVEDILTRGLPIGRPHVEAMSVGGTNDGWTQPSADCEQVTSQLRGARCHVAVVLPRND